MGHVVPADGLLRRSTPLTYRGMLRVRGRSYLVGALNQGLGQAAVAWDVAGIQGTSFAAALARSLLLAWHEGVILATAALAGSSWTDNPRAVHARSFCAVLLGLLVGVAFLWAGCRPPGEPWRKRAGRWLSEWNWRRSCRLFLLRIVYFALVGATWPRHYGFAGRPSGRRPHWPWFRWS